MTSVAAQSQQQIHQHAEQLPPATQLNEQPQQRETNLDTVLSENTAIRLYNTVVVRNTGSNVLPAVLMPASESTTSTGGEGGNLCRICRYNRPEMKIVQCPCLCRGSVGYVHMTCLKRWIMHRRDHRCEICNSPFRLPTEDLSLKRMLRAFMCARCAGLILKHLLLSASLIPLAHVILQQVLNCMDKLNANGNDQLSVQEVLVASCALLTSSALFFHFFEYITARFLVIRNVLRQWWMFGNSTDFPQIELDAES